MPGIPFAGMVGVPSQRSRAGTPVPTFRRQEYVTYRRQLHRCLDAFAQILDRFQFDEDRPMTGLELEICLVDRDWQPAMRNQDLLALFAEGDLAGVFQEELGRFNIEANIPPRLIGGTGLDDCEQYLRTTLNQAQARAESIGIGLVTIGILPTITPDHTVLANVSSNPRYSTLNYQILT
ncbi:MAG: hypothetical protein K6V36_16470, partial [Anaerolineae bacterium]|nr:hypothetical protein [Anaerolineae bacterium]